MTLTGMFWKWPAEGDLNKLFGHSSKVPSGTKDCTFVRMLRTFSDDPSFLHLSAMVPWKTTQRPGSSFAVRAPITIKMQHRVGESHPCGKVVTDYPPSPIKSKVGWEGQNCRGPSGQLFHTKPMDPERDPEQQAKPLTPDTMAQGLKWDICSISKGINHFDEKSVPCLGFLKKVNDLMNTSFRVGFLQGSMILIGKLPQGECVKRVNDCTHRSSLRV